MLKIRSFFARRLLDTALHLLIIAALLVVILGTAPTRPIRAELPGPAGAPSSERLLNPDGTLDLSTGFEGTVDLSGWEVTLDGKRGPVLRPTSVSATASTTAATAAWHALSNQGLSARVFALAVVGSDLYVGGVFSETGDGSLTNLGSMARYDTASGTWHALPKQGLDNTVFTLAVVGSDLYVGGLFTKTGDGSLTDLGRVARYDTATGTWHALNNQGLNDDVRTLAVSGSDLYSGGAFTQTGDGSLLNLGRIARYDTATGTWHALNSQGLDDVVHTLALSGSNLYAGGEFTQTGDGSLLNLGRIAFYDVALGTWHALPNQGLNSWVEALAVAGSDLYVGGLYNATGDGALSLSRIARYDTAAGTWHALPRQGLSNYVFVLAVAGSDLYVGGSFETTGDASLTNLGRIARYNLTAGVWQSLPNQGLGSSVYALAVVGGDLHVGGDFTQTGDGSVTNLGRVARYDVDHGRVYLPLVIRR